MNTPFNRRTEHVIRTALWFYLVPRTLMGFLLMGTVALAAFLIFLQIVLIGFRHLGP